MPKDATTKLARATHTAALLAEGKDDYPAAANMLDTALTHPEAVPNTHRIRALILRAGLAITMNDQPLARTLLAEVRQIPLDAVDRAGLLADLERADDLDHLLQEQDGN